MVNNNNTKNVGIVNKYLGSYLVKSQKICIKITIITAVTIT